MLLLCCDFRSNFRYVVCKQAAVAVPKHYHPQPPNNAIKGQWRCDMHPSWSRNFQWLAINALVAHPTSQILHRQVVVIFVGTDLNHYFGCAA